MPLNIVNRKSFRALFTGTIRESDLKEETYYRTKALPNVYAAMKKSYRSELDLQPWISFTSDIWSDSAPSVSMIR
jgi:hypothetical protein